MHNYTHINGGLCAAKGFAASGVNSGIKADSKKKDLMLVVSKVPCSAAAVYTQNKVQGAPIAVTRRHIQNGKAQAFLCNSGNANTCAPGGEEFARWACEVAGKATGLEAEDFIVASTGVIGQALCKQPFVKGIPLLAATLKNNGTFAADAILTTDTHRKEYAIEFTVGGNTCHMGGACKGSGMIHPNMATLLAFITTDAYIAPGMLQKALDTCVKTTLNQISIDKDTSTNDMAAVLANGLAGNAEISAEGEDYNAFESALHDVMLWMAKELAADGEGATKLLECHVSGAESDEIARVIAKTVIASDLFKTAMFGADANWGRAICAIGYAPASFAVDKISITLQSAKGSVLVCKNSAHNEFSEEAAAEILKEKEVQVLIDMGTGRGSGAAWGCDLTYDYVKINGDYRS